MPTKRPTASSRTARFARWDIVVVPFPYTDRNAEKRRPALIVSSAALEREHGLTWLVMITSIENRGWTGDVAIGNHAKAGLPAPSIIRPSKIATVDTSLVLRRIGSLAMVERAAVSKSLERYSGG